MSYVEENLQPGETVLLRRRLHEVVFLPSGSVLLLALVFSSTTSTGPVRDFWQSVASCLALVGGAAFVRALVEFLTTEYAVTSRRVIRKTGWIARHTTETMLSRIEGIRLNQSIPGRMLDFADVLVSGTGEQKNLFWRIAGPLEFVRTVEQANGAARRAQASAG